MELKHLLWLVELSITAKKIRKKRRNNRIRMLHLFKHNHRLHSQLLKNRCLLQKINLHQLHQRLKLSSQNSHNLNLSLLLLLLHPHLNRSNKRKSRLLSHLRTQRKQSKRPTLIQLPRQSQKNRPWKRQRERRSMNKNKRHLRKTS